MSGETVAIVPVRSLSSGKTRLASVLSASERSELIGEMLTQVACAALDSGEIARLLVISSNPETLAFAGSLDRRVRPVLQEQAPGLIPALDQARAEVLATGSASALVLFGDLPLIDETDVRRLIQSSGPVVIAPDQHGTGTNALLLRDSFLRDFTFMFGPDSFSRHIAEAVRLGGDPVVNRSPGTLFDLDTPEDWRALGVSRANIILGGSVRELMKEATPR